MRGHGGDSSDDDHNGIAFEDVSDEGDEIAAAGMPVPTPLDTMPGVNCGRSMKFRVEGMSSNARHKPPAAGPPSRQPAALLGRSGAPPAQCRFRICTLAAFIIFIIGLVVVGYVIPLQPITSTATNGALFNSNTRYFQSDGCTARDPAVRAPATAVQPLSNPDRPTRRDGLPGLGAWLHRGVSNATVHIGDTTEHCVQVDRHYRSWRHAQFTVSTEMTVFLSEPPLHQVPHAAPSLALPSQLVVMTFDLAVSGADSLPEAGLATPAHWSTGDQVAVDPHPVTYLCTPIAAVGAHGTVQQKCRMQYGSIFLSESNWHPLQYRYKHLRFQ
eukprot:gene3331-3833_t